MDNNADLFKFVNELVFDLKQLDEGDLAQGVESALYISTVPGEVLGQLRIELNKLVRRTESSGVPDRARIVEAIRYLDKVLG
jgi:hypothetical protein